MTTSSVHGFKVYAGLALLAAAAATVFAFTFLGARQTPMKPSTFVETAAVAWGALLLGVALARMLARR